MKINALNGALSLHRIVSTQRANNNNAVSIPKLTADSVSFSGKFAIKEIAVSPETAGVIAKSYRTSTSGHRAEYKGKTFTPEIVKLITLGMADYVENKATKEGHRPTVLIGGDTRVSTRESLPLIKDTLSSQGIDVIYIKDPVPSPLIAMEAADNDIDLAVLMTASHNPWKDGGYNFITDKGSIAPLEITAKIADNIKNIAGLGFYTVIKNDEDKGKVKEIDPFDKYIERIDNGLVDWDNIKKSGLTIYYDGLNGTGNYIVPKLFEQKGIPIVQVKSSGQEGPNPTEENLQLLESTVAQNKNNGLVVGLSNDGDADRFGVVDEQGNFISTNDVLLLVAHHLADNKGIKGAIVRSQSTSQQLDEIAEKHDLDVYETPVGFKYLGSDIMKIRDKGEDILIAGEESGGLTVFGHIPEKDGVLAISLIADLIATEKKPISEILTSLKKDLGSYYETKEVSVKLPNEDAKVKIMDKARKIYENAIDGDVDFYGTHEIDVQKTLDCKKRMEQYKPGGDGYKFIMTDGSSVLIRKSGTEPVVRTRIEAVGNTQVDAMVNYIILSEDLHKFMQEV